MVGILHREIVEMVLKIALCKIKADRIELPNSDVEMIGKFLYIS